MATFIAPAALGLGDLVVTLPIVQGLIRSGDEVHLVLRSEGHVPLATRIPGLAGIVLEWDVSSRIQHDDWLIDLRDHPLEREYWWGSKEFNSAYPGWIINDVLSTICGDKGLNVDLNDLRPLSFNADSRFEGRVVLVPGTAVSFKCWPIEHWLALYSMLAERQLKPVVVGEPDRSEAVAQLVSAGCERIATPLISDALDAVSSASGVVSVDTGIMHLSVNQGTPTVGIYRSHSVYLRSQPNFQPMLAARSCLQACHEAETRCAHTGRPAAGPEFQPADCQCQAPEGSRCLETIGGAAVYAVLNELIEVTNRYGRRHLQTSNLPSPARR